MPLPVLQDLPPEAQEFLSDNPKYKYAMSRGAQCWRCPLSKVPKCGPVPGEIRPGAPLVVIGEAPGFREVDKGKPFVHKSGTELNQSLLQGGVSRFSCTITNTLLCQPPEEMEAYLKRQKAFYKIEAEKAAAENRPIPPPPVSPVECCAPRLVNDIEETGAAPVVLAVGGQALKACAERVYNIPFGPKKKAPPGTPRAFSIKRQAGFPIILNENPYGTKILMSTLHPAFAMRKGFRQFIPVVRKDIQKAAKIAMRGGQLHWQWSASIIFPTPDEVVDACRQFREEFRRNKTKLTSDIETNDKDPYKAKIRCIDLRMRMAPTDGGTQGSVLNIVVPWRKIGGGWWYADPADRRRVFYALQETLEECDLIGHNFYSYDLVVLHLDGLDEGAGCEFDAWVTSADETRRFVPFIRDHAKPNDDTCIGHHDTPANDEPHDLGYCVARDLEATAWKWEADDKFSDQADDETLHRYCGKDGDATDELWPIIESRIEMYQTRPQYELDKRLGPISRQMGMLGVQIDEVMRLRLSSRLHEVCDRYGKKLREIVGDPNFNIDSSPQIRRYLYVKKGLIPVLSTSGKAWKKGDDPTTSIGALILLQDRGVEKDVDQFIDTLIEYRAYNKLLTTYVDGLDDKLHDEIRYGKKVRVLHPSWRVHTVPSGRWACTPTIANWPEMGRLIECVLCDGEGALRSGCPVCKLAVWDRRWNQVMERWVEAWYVLKPGEDAAGRPMAWVAPLNMRVMVVAAEGHVIVHADYSALELRGYTIAAKDRALRTAFTSLRHGKPIDAHVWNAASMWVENPDGIPDEYDKIRGDPADMKKRKGCAKRYAFLKIYGGQGDKLYDTMLKDRDKSTGERLFPKLDRKLVAKWDKGWDVNHQEMFAWQADRLRQARTLGYTKTFIHGRKRFFPPRINDQGACFNHEIQGGGADMENDAIIEISEKIGFRKWSPYSGLIIQVHDSTDIQVPKERAEEAMKIQAAAMEREIDGIKFGVEQKAVERWNFA